QSTTRAARRIAILMPDYPGAPGRTGYAVGLDVPASVVALLADLTAAGYGVRKAPQTSGALLTALDVLCTGSATISSSLRCGKAHSRDTLDWTASLPLATYVQLLGELPAESATRIRDAWGDPADDPDVRDGAFRFRVCVCGNAIVALPPDRGRSAERR